MGDRISVVVGEPTGLVSVGLVASLRQHDDVEIVGECGDLEELLSLLEEHRPRVAVVALDLRGLDEHDDLVSPLREVAPDLKVIVVSESTTDTAVVRAFRAYADGFVLKDEALEMLPIAVSAVMRGGARSSTGGGWHPDRPGLQGCAQLRGTVRSDRARAARRRAARTGMTNREIGEQMGITAGTVATHVANAVAKLGADNRYEAADIVEREGITAPGR